MISVMSVANLGAFASFLVVDDPGSALVPHPTLMAFLDEILELVYTWTKP